MLGGQDYEGECAACGGPYPNPDCGHLKNARDFSEAAPCQPAVKHPTGTELDAFALRMVVERMQFRIDAMNEKELPGVSISKGFAVEIVAAAKHGAARLEALAALVEAPRDD